MTEDTIKDGKNLAIIAYLTFIGSVIAIIMNDEKKNEFTAFHIRQGLGLCLTYVIIGYMVSQFDSLNISMAFWIGFGILFFYGIVSAINGKTQEVPLLGKFYQQIFSGIGN